MIGEFVKVERAAFHKVFTGRISLDFIGFATIMFYVYEVVHKIVANVGINDL
ncbi:hypothetical protein SAMN05192533_10956 [Mesobacillus persicus]|uniref:Uncharacterized protein n=1 Tax=Mesobacillus persicus TaxID=930146 RepID=A0A1H8DWH2_9BACI|nr:hypothetical protein SAMN05192533_10956 [Mesobacillus persicus]